MAIFIFLFGLIIGSFINVLADRLPRDEHIGGRSRCPRCQAVLVWYDLFPVVSFLFLGGRCRHCRQKISWQYPLIEIITGLLFLLVFNWQFPFFDQWPVFNFSFLNLFYFLFITACLLVIFISDLRYYIIPDQIIYAAIIFTVVYRGWFFRDLLGNNLMAAFLAGGFFLTLVLVSAGAWMGWGDVKLALVMGLILGWPKVLLALFLAFFVGAAVGLGLIFFGRKNWKSEIPFGTFLSASAFLIFLAGDRLISIVNDYWWW